MTCEWRQVAGWPSYEASSTGLVRSTTRIQQDSMGRNFLLQGRVLKTYVKQTGYHVVTLKESPRSKQLGVHQVVALAFLGPRPEGMEVRHLNDDKSNNCLANLRYGTRSENTYDRVINGIHPMASKTHCKHGHPFTPENTVVRSTGARACRTCRAERSHTAYLSKKAAA